MSIPKKIFQTHITYEYIKNNPILFNAVKSWQKPNYEYLFYDDNDCDVFMKTYFDDKTYEAYNKCILPVMKADLWRYCIIYIYGGIYADTDTILNTNPCILTNHKKLLVITPENNCHFCQWVFAAPPKSPILKEIIKLCTERLLNFTYPSNEHFVHYLTGPALFTEGIHSYLNSINKNIDMCEDLIYIFKHSSFHTKFIKHLFTGSYKHGWIQQRDNLHLKYENTNNKTIQHVEIPL